MLCLESQWLPAKYRRAQWDRHDFAPVEKLHDGMHSLVYQVRDKLTGDLMCLKVYKKSALTAVERRCVHRELRIHTQIHHQHAIQGYAAWEDASFYNLVMEFATEGNLFQEVHRRGGFLPESTTVNLVILPLLSSLTYLHSKGIIHRDLKPENMMFGKCGKDRLLKLADFGLSINCWEEAPTSCTGTVDYMAPEVVICPPQLHEGQGHYPEQARYSQAVDVWAVGILVYELMVGAPPFEDPEGPQSTARNILYSEPVFEDVLSSEAKDFISRTLTKDPSRRPTMAQLMGHPWIQAHSTSMSVRYTGAPVATQLRRGPVRQRSWHGERAAPFAALQHSRMGNFTDANGHEAHQGAAMDCGPSADFAPSTSQAAADVSCQRQSSPDTNGYQSLSALAAQGAIMSHQRQHLQHQQAVQLPPAEQSTHEFDSATSYPTLAAVYNENRDDSAAGFQMLKRCEEEGMPQDGVKLDSHPSLEAMLLNTL